MRISNLIFILAIVLSSNVQAGKFNQQVSVGDAVSTWNNLPGVDDQSHSMKDYKEAKILVTVFSCNICPCSATYRKRLIELQAAYKNKGVQVVMINVNADETLAEMKKVAAADKLNFPYLFDGSQKSAEDYGAMMTPQVFLLDQRRNIAYMGAVDDNLIREKVTIHYLKDALDAVLVGKKPEVTETRPFGCRIPYEE